MENDTTESTESTESYGEGDTVPTQDDGMHNNYGMDDDYSVNTEGSAEDNQDTDEFNQEDFDASLNDYMRENYELPEKFKDVGAMIESYKHLEGKMGNMKGAPETYELEDSVFDNYSEAVLTDVVDAAQKMGIDNDGLNQLLGSAQNAQAKEQEANWEMEKHKMGQNADREIADALQELNGRFSPEISETIQGMIQTADQFYALRDIMQGGKSSQPAHGTQPAQAMTDEKINEMLFAKDQWGSSKMETDQEYANKVNNIMKAHWN